MVPLNRLPGAVPVRTDSRLGCAVLYSNTEKYTVQLDLLSCTVKVKSVS